MLKSSSGKVLAGVIVALFALLLLEAALRVGQTIQQDLGPRIEAPREWAVYSPLLGWERRPSWRGVVGNHPREFDERGYFTVDSGQVDDASKPKVLFIGDSNTFGFGVPTVASFPEVVDALLPEVHTINVAVPGYTSYQGLVSLEKYLPLVKPALVVASFNYNDRRYVLPRDGVDGPQKFQSVYQAASTEGSVFQMLLERSYLARAQRAALRAAGVLPEPLLDLRVDEVEPRVGETAYRQNLSKMRELTRRAGVPLVFLVLKDSPIETHHLDEGVRQLGSSNALAIAHLRTAMAARNLASDVARLYLSKAYRAAGDARSADEVLISHNPVQSLHGGQPVRRDIVYNRIMREVGGELGVALVDGSIPLDRHPHAYIDFCHFDADGHRRVGELLAASIPGLLSRTDPAGPRPVVPRSD